MNATTELLREVEQSLHFDEGLAATAHLAAGRPIYYVDRFHSGQIIKKFPDGRRQLVSVDEKGVVSVLKEL